MSKLLRENAILPFVPNTDLSAKEGFAVMADGAEIALVEDVAEVPLGVVVHGTDVTEKTSVAIAAGGLAGTVRVKLGAAVADVGTLLQIREDATFETAAGAGRVICAQALETGVADELIEAVLFKPYAT